MAAITLAEVKTILGITDSSKDTLINLYIPIVINEIVKYCNQDFRLDDITLSGSDISFSSSTNTIDTTSSDFVDNDFFANEVVIEDSKKNDQIYLVETVAQYKLTIDSNWEVITESADNDITIYNCKFPLGMKPYLAAMIGQRIENSGSPVSQGVGSEKLGDYSISYDGTGLNYAYSKSIISALNLWRKPTFV